MRVPIPEHIGDPGPQIPPAIAPPAAPPAMPAPIEAPCL